MTTNADEICRIFWAKMHKSPIRKKHIGIIQLQRSYQIEDNI